MANTKAQDKLDAMGADAVCDLIRDGVSMTKIAKDAGVSIGGLINWIAADDERSTRVRFSRVQAAAVWDEMALNRMDDAADPFELAKAKEIGFHLRWRASKIAPREYGDKLEHTGAGGGAVVLQVLTGVPRLPEAAD